MGQKKKQLPPVDESVDGADQPEQVSDPEPMVEFRNGASWSGERFSFVPGEIITLSKTIAEARQEAGLGEIITAE